MLLWVWYYYYVLSYDGVIKKGLDRSGYFDYSWVVQGNSCDINASVLSLPHFS